MTHDAPPPHALKRLKHQGNRATWLIQPPQGPPTTLKTWRLTPALSLKLLLGRAQPQRQVRGAALLAAAGIPVAKPTGPWRFARRAGHFTIELELEYLPGLDGVEWLRDQSISPADRRAVARLVGQLVAALVRRNLHHRDHKPTNVIISQTPAGPRVALIDTVAVRRCRNQVTTTADMLAHLAFIPKTVTPTATKHVTLPLLREALGPLAKAERQAVLKELRARMEG